MSIFAKSHSHDGAVEADKILHWLIELYEKEKVKQQLPNKHIDNRSYQMLQPTEEHFKSVFFGYARRANKRKACSRIRELLVEMERLSEAGLTEVKPTYKVSLLFDADAS